MLQQSGSDNLNFATVLPLDVLTNHRAAVEEITVQESGSAATAAVLYSKSKERANSAQDSLFPHNLQAWVPLRFEHATGAIRPLTFPASVD
jgi:hypothetical protein